jgi:hypothetical protein
MNFLRRMILCAGTAAFLALPAFAHADAGTNATPDFHDVYDLIRAHLTGESEDDLNREAVAGLLAQLHGRVSLVTNQPAAPDAPVLGKSALYDGSIGRLPVLRVLPGLAKQISDTCQAWNATNHLQGLVLDLRYANGNDYEEAANVADLFLTNERPLLDWGKGMVQSKANPSALTLPLTILVNQHTAEAAEALAAILRDNDRAIILGATTAGEAAMSQEFPLKTGGALKIATSPIKLGQGETLSGAGVKPDIAVSGKPDDEMAYYADPFMQVADMTLLPSLLGQTNVTLNITNRPHLINEAELMRERKARPGVDIQDLDLSSAPQDVVPEKPIVLDPVLGRALDLVKGIAAMHNAPPR